MVMILSVGMTVVAGAVAVAPSLTLAANGHNMPGVTAGPKGLAIDSGSVGRPSNAPVSEASFNWAGYVLVPASGYDGYLSSASGSWYVPSTTCYEPTGKNVATYQSNWVGIDGISDGYVEQAGTLLYCSGAGATPAYYAWTEFYPAAAIYYTDTYPGDFISVNVQYNYFSGLFTVELVDATQGWYTSYAGFGGDDSSAECISEAPSSTSGILNLTDYGTSKFYGCSATIYTTTAGIGDFKAAVGTTYEFTQYGFTTDKIDQKVSKLTSTLYKDDTFTTTWKGLD